jgi:hypothetical protein
MAINKVDLTVSQLINDLNEGMTWLEKDNLGYGSIETKYRANEKQILAIRKHPKLVSAETNITIFNIIDDTTNEITTGKTNEGRNTIVWEKQVSSKTMGSPTKESICKIQQETVEMAPRLSSVDTNNSEAVDIFAQL